MAEPGVDVIVVSYRTPGDLVAFAQSFTEVAHEVPCSLYVINVAPELDDEMAAEGIPPLLPDDMDTNYVMFKENVGYNIACNEVASISKREIIAFFNADTRLRPGVLGGMYHEMLAHPMWGVAGPRQIDDYNRITHAGIYGTRAEPSFDGRWQQQDEGQFTEIRDDCVSVSGSAYFVRRELWEELTNCLFYRVAAPLALGAFLPTAHYYGETFCSYHAIEHGYQVAYVGSLLMTHKWHQASPVGGWAEENMSSSQEEFRKACFVHSIPCD